MSTSSQLPAPRLVVTTHTKDGTSVFESDAQVTTFAPFGPQGSSFGRFHSRLSVPASNTTSPPALPNAIPRCPPEGVLFCTTDIPPNYTVPMHRTISLDYCAVMSGEIVLRLDGDEEKTVKAGEFIVQRGVNHQWINRTNEVCRIVFVMVGTQKIVLEDGTALEETVFKK
jgi:quercetin dioxygenase-like cupin family protein